jgi:iron complex transport system ATP-binding protein
MMLTVNELRFMYRNKDVLKQIGFSIEEGKVIAVLGPNGVGKTTLLKCLNRILKPRKGTVMLYGENLLDLSTMDIARRVGYVPQRVETGRLTAFDAVLLGRRPYIGWDISTRDITMVDAIFTRLGMESLRLSYIDEMSGGELQKVAIARAIVRDHKIAAIMTMHDLNQALRFADTFIFIKNGTVHIHGNHDIVTPAVIEDVYGLPVMIGEFGGIRCVIPGAANLATGE